MEGTIVKGIGGFYYIQTPDAQIVECKARGIFRKEGTVPHIGDRVDISLLKDEEGKGMIDKILPRKNVFVRPPVANVDCFIIVTAAAKPAPNLLVLDQFLIMAEEKRTDILLCFNKVDLVSEEKLQALAAVYSEIYPVYFASSKTGQGMEELKAGIRGRKVALAGPSGVGKSTILNYMLGDSCMETGEISKKTSRGKHTTRHAELFSAEDGGMIFDTPGFTSFDVLEAEEEELAYLFPEMEGLAGKCYYDNCRHLSEPECAVRKALAEGKIHRSRYDSYKELMLLLQKKKKY